MKNLYDYENTQSANTDLPFGAFKNESSPGQKDGTDIIAEHIQDIAYPLYQVLQLAGIVPNGELEDGNNKKQFIQALTNIGILKHAEGVSYEASILVWRIVGTEFALYRSNFSENNADLSDEESWTKILTIDNKNKINFHVETNISGSLSLPTFCFNSGAVDSDGNSALMTVENDILTLNAPAVGTTADGETFTVSENITLDISNLADGSYNCFYNPETNGLEIYNNEIFEQKAEPENWSINDIWVNTSIMPNVSYKKVSDTEKVVTKLVQTADVERVSNGGG